ncbi:carboxylating nicotinate-nucleotide diphosphorylase [Arthrobacter castelli]|uniref:carboxylating nicotinate-nucleotide diphosphorylase n=1 Tax=Arthrobacter castelli TaxID=271431 RepID=UPI003CCC37EA
MDPVDPAGILPLDERTLNTVVEAALAEDAPWGDITTTALVPDGVRATAGLSAREAGVLAGSAVFAAAMRLTDPAITVRFHVADGGRFGAGTQLATVSGPARSVLTAERVGLNLLQRMSGIATTTAGYVAAAGANARIADTRKTTPGLRAVERYAVRCGGGHNHRFGLSDAVMAKDNHLAVLTRNGSGDLTTALRQAKAKLPHTVCFEVEVDRLDQIEAVAAAGVDVIMLDNFTTDELVEGVQLVAGRAVVEASGSVNLETVGAIARTGVDVVSVGALTHSVRSLDLGLDIDVEL